MSGTLPQPLFNVLATGSTTPRLLSDRFSDVINLADYLINDPGGAYVAANSTAYQGALNAAAGRTVILPVSLSIVHTQLVINNSVELIINGQMKLAPTSAGQTIYSSIVINASNVTIRLGATGVVDGNKATQLGTLYGPYGAGGGIVTAQNPGAIDSPLPTQGVTRFSDIYVYGPGTVQNCWTWPVSINNTLRCKVMYVRMLNCNNAPGVDDGTHRFEWAHNYCENNPDYGFAAYQGCYNGSFHHNICMNVATIGVDNDGDVSTGYNLWPCHNIQIHDNIVINSTNAGCSITSSSVGGSAAWHYDIDVFDNHFINCATTTSNPIIFADGVVNLSVKRNLISGGGNASFANNSGIGANSATHTPGMVVEHNIIENLINGTSSSFGILVGAVGLICRNNIIRDTRTSKTMQYGTFGTCGAGTIITDNIITGMTVANNGHTPAGDTIFRDGASAAGSFTTLTETAGFSFSGGTFAAGSISTDANWGGMIKGRSGVVADVSLQSSAGNTGLKMVASGLVSLPLGVATSAPTTVTATTYTVAATDNSLILNPAAAQTLTLPSASANPGRILNLKLIAAFAVSSATSNVVPITSATAGTAILAGTAGKWCVLQSDSTNWIIIASN